ncbi:hypothetical protein GCM10010149_23690 [Nonomuraea roseoviolacea subsp. roseoviolacea]|uniref:ABC transporter ATP-binding protein n=1 Tax=Nonomuraea roseoviolacea subsp. carminata TaxID=160689 RepID=A0ABT1JTD6_9ACTN|nr:hypothetical protein [Nonomuraea roseoviolacea]MCP2344541.1 hypothetical protein [Nonomuraea roseoviolacea subsp. carminata]
MRTLSITATPRTRHGWRERLQAGARGALAMLMLLSTAADAWLSALLGLPLLAPAVRRLAAVIADECRACAAGAIDADVIEDPERQVWR